MNVKFFKLSTVLLFCIFSMTVMAQTDKVDNARNVEHLSKTLSTSLYNAVKVDSIITQHKIAVKSLENDQSLTITEKRKKYQVLVSEKINKLRATLNDTQIKKLLPTTELQIDNKREL